MQPIPIPDSQLFQGARRITIGAPSGSEEWCKPLEALYVQAAIIGANKPIETLLILVELDPIDIKSLEECQRFWLIFHGPIAPFQFANYLPKMNEEHEHKFVLCDPHPLVPNAPPAEVCLLCGIPKDDLESETSE